MLYIEWKQILKSNLNLPSHILLFSMVCSLGCGKCDWGIELFMGDEMFTVASIVSSHQLAANLFISLIEQIPFCSFGGSVIFLPWIESHYEYYFSASCGFIFQFILPLCSQLCNLFVFRHLLQWLTLPPGINKVNRISFYPTYAGPPAAASGLQLTS